jgi:hypothetical protein
MYKDIVGNVNNKKYKVRDDYESKQEASNKTKTIQSREDTN